MSNSNGKQRYQGQLTTHSIIIPDFRHTNPKPHAQRRIGAKGTEAQVLNHLEQLARARMYEMEQER